MSDGTALREDVWSARETTPDDVEAALRAMLHERHAADARCVPARVLNLVVVVDRELKGEVKGRLGGVGRYHASRTIICSAGERDGKAIDARAVMTYEDGPGANLSPMHETVEIDLGLRQLGDLGTIVDPLLVSELPTVLWCPHGHLDEVASLLRLTDVVLLDSDDDPDPGDTLSRAGSLAARHYVVDLAWLRTTPWRERIAATYDPAYRRCELPQICRVTVRHRSISTASGLLLVAWLASRLGWEVEPLTHGAGGTLSGRARRGDGESVTIELEAASQDVPGLVGVTVVSARGFTLSLDRAPGGLKIARRRHDGTEAEWQVMGSSRGEGGILGEGVRQALLRDRTYPPALVAARTLLGAGRSAA